MKKLTVMITVLIGVLFSAEAFGQNNTQTIRGTLVDQDTKKPLQGGFIQVAGGSDGLGTLTEEDGKFRLENVPLGRVTLLITYVGYEDKFVPDILVGSGKEVVLVIEMIESVNTLKSTEVNLRKNRQKVLNDMAVVSARSFSVEETKRYAGAIDDPARMVSSFAGVNGNAEGNNDIVVRGNSPRGILWRLEGVEIPNPNHFAAEGGTGGPINALNSAMLGNSDFYTGAFAPEYGNALSGVFDMNLRNGNNEKREYATTLSILGTDITAEGPFKKNYGGSYLVNYRYSTLSILDEAGIVDFGGVPKYQDACFKLRLPMGKKHTMTVFGLGGMSSISQQSTSDDEDRTLWEAEYAAKLGVLGVSHTYLISDKMYLKTILSQQATQNNGYYKIPDEKDNLYTVSKTSFTKSKLIASSNLNYKLNSRNKFKVGFIANRLGFDMRDEYWSFETDQLEPTLSQKGTTGTIQAFASWKYRVTSDLDMVTGMHYVHFLLNGQGSVEPRWAMNWKQSKKQSYSVGFGMHSRVESIATYLGQELQDNGSFVRHNENLGLSKAAHVVAGYTRRFNAITYLKAEMYYQHLFNVPVEGLPGSTFSMLNSSEWFTTRKLTNEGKGRNYGLELTLERSFQKGYYYMSTVSLYKSLYTPYDGVERRTRYDGNYVVNFLGGKEFKIGNPVKQRVLFVNTKLALIGGSRYTRILLDESIAKGDVVRDEAHPFAEKGDDVLKWDLAIGVRRNRKSTTTELKIDIQNLTNNKAVVNQYYDHATESILVSNQLPMLPVLSYKVNF